MELQGIVLIIGAALLLCLAYFLISMMRSNFAPVQYVFYCLAYLLTRLLWRATIPQELAVPDGQGAIIITNHCSSVDPFFMQMAADRPIHWMVAREYCEHFAFGPFLRVCEVIPVNRGGVDTAATKQAIRMASAGKMIGMFPEGRINMTDQFMLAARPGAVLVAIKAKVPVVPCYIEGSPYGGTPWSPFFMFARTKVRFGKPIDVTKLNDESDNSAVREIMIKCLKAIAELAGEDEFEPVLAGKKWKPTQDELDADVAALRKRQDDETNPQ
ncbi:MAG: 1-acyl-sn-glycerol-3-phosphate acyltransferase [Pirellulaceae bacterium]|jgi:1-acyl-sn-glycerol-3-phosphate acyltransferase